MTDTLDWSNLESLAEAQRLALWGAGSLPAWCAAARPTSPPSARASSSCAPACARWPCAARRRVENHLGSIHALALGNLCELAAGMVTEVTTPPGTRWIPRGMTIEYLRKAESEVCATARLDKSDWSAPGNVAVPVSVADKNGNEVVRAVITMHIAARQALRLRSAAARYGPMMIPRRIEVSISHSSRRCEVAWRLADTVRTRLPPRWCVTR